MGGRLSQVLIKDVAAYLIDAMAALKFTGANAGKTMLCLCMIKTSYLLVGIGADVRRWNSR